MAPPGSEWTDMEKLYLQSLCETYKTKSGARAWGLIHDKFTEEFPESGRTKHALHQEMYRTEAKMPANQRPQRRVYKKKKSTGDVVLGPVGKDAEEGGDEEIGDGETYFEGFSSDEEQKDSDDQTNARTETEAPHDQTPNGKEAPAQENERRETGRKTAPLPERQQTTPGERLEILEGQLRLMQESVATIREDLKRRNSTQLG